MKGTVQLDRFGCAYGQVTRQKFEDFAKAQDEIKGDIKALNDKVTDLFNHQSNRLPPWVTLMIAFLCSLLTGLIVFIVTHKAAVPTP